MHRHREIEIVYHSQGSGVTAMEDGSEIEFEPKSTVIYPARCLHDQRMFKPGIDICVHMALPKSAGIDQLFEKTRYIPPDQGEEMRRANRYVHVEFLQIAQERNHSVRRLELDLRITALVVRLFHGCQYGVSTGPDSSPDMHLRRARQYIATHYARITSMGEIARHLEISEDYLRHLFAARGGTSLNRLLNHTRLERVKELLTHSRLPIKEIASLSGFKTERYLCTCFRKYAGISPAAFRRRATNHPFKTDYD